ncbi:2-amino-4-hydroxy-6-hydroxymethyldihydropteridine diphosphokinase [Acinetobacter sp.]|uniref:2-amino-4-hydroxy-6- hydroxymethyldihydropteridine diphosphokinase n=1 Tax=Acinetobacter sp. TaxID=472 RepID=UPI00282ED41D|nr:2-amino-4-hydroxy-6-hydroxymethyldihydropteridine diphosphokinase [Acinetobacter sp.]MDR0236018.1 2-amino-4-hydroxy-6-hydroxymethyldihydropteridine diphosphokinase [Acinetobacter sp.]
MNATETIFALALASNNQPQHNFQKSFRQIESLGETLFSQIYLIPCRDGIGADYWNAACLLKSYLSVEQMISKLKQMEADSGRTRPSHQISLDIDLIAWGKELNAMHFNSKKLPLALDVKIPMFDLWQDAQFNFSSHQFPVIDLLY